MPELPEVETIARRLRRGSATEPKIVGRTVVRVAVPSSRAVQQPSRPAFIKLLRGARILDVGRRAKHLIVTTDRGTLLIHLRMTGDLHVSATPPATPSLRAAFHLDNGTVLAFTDPRHLGELRLVDDPAPLLAALGPEPLGGELNDATFAARLTGKRSIKAALLDQTVIGGVGNIYGDEALFRAGIWPARPAASLTAAEAKRLLASIRAVLEDSIRDIERQGGDIRWRYQDRASESPFFVYDRGGEPCRQCGAQLSVLKVGGRTTVACRACQHAPPGRRARSTGATSLPKRKRAKASREHGAAPPPPSRGGTRGRAR